MTGSILPGWISGPTRLGQLMGPLKSFLLTGFATIKPAGLIEKYKREKKSAHRHSFRMKRHQIGREFTFSLQFGGITGTVFPSRSSLSRDRALRDVTLGNLEKWVKQHLCNDFETEKKLELWRKRPKRWSWGNYSPVNLHLQRLWVRIS